MNDGITAFYLRLSIADGDLGINKKDESNSIENQRLLLDNFFSGKDDLCGEVKEYIDDGYTGTNFNRPGFQKMLEDAKAGIVKTVVVKDLSRLGRDYIGVCDYVEQIFPILGVRFIAVNNNFDSASYGGTTMGLDVEVTSLINNLYSRDTSKKVRSAFETKWKQGYATASNLPFGYLKDLEHHGKWIVDPVASKFVRRIFDLALQGRNTSQIAYQLNEEKIPTPGMYEKMYKQKDPSRLMNGANGMVSPDSEQFWTTGTVREILKKYEYTGALVMGKRKKMVLEEKRRVKVPEENWTIAENAHEALVTHEEFENAQKVIHSTHWSATGKKKRDYPLKGFVRCGTCRRHMEYRIKDGEGIFVCRYKQDAMQHSSCYGGIYKESVINAVVAHAIRQMLKGVRFLEVKRREDSEKRVVSMHLPDIDKLKSSLDILQEERIRQYEAYADGVVNRDAYLTKKQKLTEQINELQAEIQRTEDILKAEEESVTSVSNIKEEGEKQPQTGPLTAEMVKAFIDAVYLYDDTRIEVVFKCDDLLDEAVDRYMADQGMEKGENGVWRDKNINRIDG